MTSLYLHNYSVLIESTSSLHSPHTLLSPASLYFLFQSHTPFIYEIDSNLFVNELNIWGPFEFHGMLFMKTNMKNDNKPMSNDTAHCIAE